MTDFIFFQDQSILIFVVGGGFFLTIKLLDLIFTFIGRKINKIVRGKPNSICEHCCEGDCMYGKSHIVKNVDGSIGVVLCKEHLVESVKNFNYKGETNVNK